MLIDWFTVGAQALNFLILVWLMKRFLYKPILHAIEEREKRIAAELAEADKKKQEAQKENDEFKRKNEEFDRQRAALLAQATDEAKGERQRLLDDARKAADALSLKQREALKSEGQNIRQALSRRARQEVFAIARKTLMDLSGTSLEERLGDIFIRRLKEMDAQAKTDFAAALRTASGPAVLRSAFDLTREQQGAIQKSLNETFSAEIPIRFETSADLIGGIEMTANGQKVAWSIADYLASLEKGVDEILSEKEKSEAQASKSSDLTNKITQRAYELYQQGDHKGDTAVRDWRQAEREVSQGKADGAPKPEVKDESKSGNKVELKPELKAEPMIEAKNR